MEDCPDAPNMLAISVYDSKPVHFLTYHETCVMWLKQTKKVWNKRVKKMVEIEFWRLGVIQGYNKSMGWVDVADQLRNYYRMDKNMRNRKYWWAHYHWALGIMTTNAYIYYKRVCDHAGVPAPDRKTHLNFQVSALSNCFSLLCMLLILLCIQVGIIMGLLFPPQKIVRRRARDALERGRAIAEREALRQQNLREGALNSPTLTRQDTAKKRKREAKLKANKKKNFNPSSFRLTKKNLLLIDLTRCVYAHSNTC